MRKLRITWILVSLLVATSMLLASCATPTATEAPAAGETPAGTTLSVGVILPTKDEPRWIQDETRFKDAFVAAGYEVEILFSQGDSALEKSNVEGLIAKGVKVIIICPQDATAAAAAAAE
ncbi:MAG TPA: substrate-binding domain-containing protein, partial [Bellilinea sp.]|nr:substrate-binding domain-containing protein [Bellilinea sp.]